MLTPSIETCIGTIVTALLLPISSANAAELELRIGPLSNDKPLVIRNLLVDEKGNFYLDEKLHSLDELRVLRGKSTDLWSIEEAPNVSDEARAEYHCKMESLTTRQPTPVELESCKTYRLSLLKKLENNLYTERTEKLKQQALDTLHERSRKH